MKRQRGVTLVELVIALTLIAIAGATLYSAMAVMGSRSADPMLRQQSLALAESYLEEILLQPFADPASGSQCPAAPGARASFDNVCDYAGLVDNGARNRFGEAIAGLQDYRVSVSVTPQAWSGLSADRVLLVQVQVQDPAGGLVRLDSYRVKHD